MQTMNVNVKVKVKSRKKTAKFPNKMTDADSAAVGYLLDPVVLADEISKLLLKAGLQNHPECQSVYREVALFTRAQWESWASKRAEIKAIKARAVKAHKAAIDIAEALTGQARSLLDLASIFERRDRLDLALAAEQAALNLHDFASDLRVDVDRKPKPLRRRRRAERASSTSTL